MTDLLVRQAKKNYENLSKEVRELYTLDDFIKEVIKKYNEQENNNTILYKEDGYDLGFNDGFNSGYDRGYDIGYKVALALIEGKLEQLKELKGNE